MTDLDKAMEEGWESARKLIIEQGDDPDALLSAAARNIAWWQEHATEADMLAAVQRWAEHEATLDDCGRTEDDPDFGKPFAWLMRWLDES